MGFTITLSLNDEFRVACILYGTEPEAFLQEFVFNVRISDAGRSE